MTIDEIADTARATMRDAYWQRKDVVAAIEIGTQTIADLERLAEADAASRDAALAQVKSFTYDIASFTWPGWGEPGIELSDGLVALGAASAERNLALAQELSKPPIARSRAHWMLAAHRLTARRFDDAHEGFITAAALAADDGVPAEEVLSLAFAALAECGAGDDGASRRLDSRLAELRAMPEGDALADQVVTAAEVVGVDV